MTEKRKQNLIEAAKFELRNRIYNQIKELVDKKAVIKVDESETDIKITAEFVDLVDINEETWVRERKRHVLVNKL